VTLRIARGLLVIAALLALVYVVDDLAVRYRLTRGSAYDPLDAVSVYYATRLKNKAIEIFYHEPVTETCVRALFPHLGHAPCWYLRRHTVRLVRAVFPPPDPWPSTSA
jgi:hypothetical protein